MVGRSRPLGSFNNWLILRLGEVALLSLSLLFLFAKHNSLSLLWQTSALGLLSLLPIYFHPFAFGYADDQGIVFCRYFKLHFVPWTDVIRVQCRQWNAFELVVLLSRPVVLTRTIKFPMNLGRHEVDAAFSGSWTPEIVNWLIERMKPSMLKHPG